MSAEDRSIITCAGNQSLFARIHPEIVDALALKPIDWKRSYGRPLKKVRLTGHFIPFDVHQLPRTYDETRILKDPVLHLYWIDCDIDTYKKKVRDDVFMWQSALKALSIPDWLIIVVVHDENKVKTKILRTSVYDKVKSEFNSKVTNRCILFSEPLRNAPKSEAWSTIITRIQELMLDSFSRALTRFEDRMRLERERRSDADWTFSKYFMLQEELAKFYYMLELADDALIQYDELDALFAQFIVNNSIGATASWLQAYKELSSGWEGVSMSTDVQMYRRMLISEGKPSLLDLRNYMFSKQCDLLIRLERPAELTNRSLKFIHNTIHELRLLEVDVPPGAISCWVFLTCKELLNICEPFKDTLGMEVYSVYTSPLWTCLQSVTHKLGCLCGLMPGVEPSSEELHSVVQLVSGISSSNTSTRELAPRDKLKKVLSSSAAFCDYYVELTELTMGTLKYIGHSRMAKVLGQQLAKFYMCSNLPHQAETFLLNCLQLFGNDRWTQLELDTWELLSECEKKMESYSAYLKACAKIACHDLAGPQKRLAFSQKVANFMTNSAEPVTVSDETSFILDVTKVRSDIFTHSTKIDITVRSLFVVSLQYNTVSLLIKPSKKNSNHEKRKKGLEGKRYPECRPVILTPYSITNEDGDVAVGLECANTHALLSHRDSQANSHMIRNLSKNQLDTEAEAEEISLSLDSGQLNPGTNSLSFILKKPEFDEYEISQMMFKLQHVDLYIPVKEGKISVEKKECPYLQIDMSSSLCYIGVGNKLKAELLNNIDHLKPTLQMSNGRVEFLDTTPESNDKILLLQPRSDTVTPGIRKFQLSVEFEEDDGHSSSSYTLECCCPLEVQSKVFTAAEQKFAQIMVFSLVPEIELMVSKPNLILADSEGPFFTNMNGDSTVNWTLTKGSQLSFLWSIDLDKTFSETLKCLFTLEFGEINSISNHFQTEINLSVIKTQFILSRHIKAGIPMSPLSLSRQSSTEQILSLSPPSEISSMSPANTWQALCECEMVVKLEMCDAIYNNDPIDLTISYEILADPNWAISGSKTGTLQLYGDSTTASIGVKLMPLVGGSLHMPEVRLRNDNNEEFLPGQVYDSSKLCRVSVINVEE